MASTTSQVNGFSSKGSAFGPFSTYEYTPSENFNIVEEIDAILGSAPKDDANEPMANECPLTSTEDAFAPVLGVQPNAEPTPQPETDAELTNVEKVAVKKASTRKTSSKKSQTAKK